MGSPVENKIKNVIIDENQAVIDSYGASSKAYGSSNRDYTNIEPNISVRNEFGRADYEAFRGNESDPKKLKGQINACNNVYNEVGIVRNVIDLMGDFAGQGLSIVHPDKRVEKFYKNWYRKIKGTNVSERFLNYLYRMGNVIVNRTNARITKKREDEFKKATAEQPQDNEDITVYRRTIPWSYEFLNPVAVDVERVNGEKVYFIKINNRIYNGGKVDSSNDYLPEYIREIIKTGKKKIALDPDSLGVYFYKKDDWLPWAVPMVKPILKDLVMLDKMKLADHASLDGIMSAVRLWIVGNLEHKIPPNMATINKLRDILSSHVGGGVVDLIWGPELSFQESSSEAYKFLGNEKYVPVLNNIFTGLGISSAIAGGSGGNGGYTNNFVSIKTLIERLEYGREVLTDFWNNEFEIVRKAMKFKQAAQIHFDSIILADEAAIKTLFISLLDRDLISQETLLERFREIPEIEKIRVEREHKQRMSSPDMPQKASPYHNPQNIEDLAGQALNSGNLGPEYFERKGLPFREAPLPPKPAGGIGSKKKPKKAGPSGGRPKNTVDTKSRKQRRVLPRSKGIDSNKLMWALDAQKTISDILTPTFLSVAQKKNVRSLSNSEFDMLEDVKLRAFLCLEFGQKIDETFINDAVSRNVQPSPLFFEKLESVVSDFITLQQRRPNVDELRTIYAAIFADVK